MYPFRLPEVSQDVGTIDGLWRPQRGVCFISPRPVYWSGFATGTEPVSE